LTDEQLQQQVAPGKNRVFYLLGHLTAMHDRMFPLLGLGERLHPELHDAYITNPDRVLGDPLSATDLRKAWAFAELCYRHSGRILFTLSSITKNREDAEDAFQEAILNAFVHFGDFKRASSFATWLTRISINSALMVLRKRRVRPEALIDEPIDEGARHLQWDIADRRPNPEQYYLQSESHRRLQSAISELPTVYRRVFEIRLRSDGSMKEIAEEVGITIAATNSRLLRARSALHSSIG
jgi:RNA polymerase sigma-70 factor, ECF subfamily